MSLVSDMLKDFFKLNTPYTDIDEDDIVSYLEAQSEVQSALFRPDSWPKSLNKLKNMSFSNVSLSKTAFSKVTFTRCEFTDCLFIGCIFEDVEFHSCKFVNCNFYKSKFERCYINPNSFKFKFKYKLTHANVGVSLFQNLMENSAKEKQSLFEKISDIKFRKWKNWQSKFDYNSNKIGLWRLIYTFFANFVYDAISGYGYKPIRFVFFTIFIFTSISWANTIVLPDIISVDGRDISKIDFYDSLFYTYSMLTGLGFSYIVPLTPIAKIYSVAMAFFGIGWLSLFTSMIVKRFLK